MMRVDRTAKVYLAVGATDLRKAINGLSILAQQQWDRTRSGAGISHSATEGVIGSRFCIGTAMGSVSGRNVWSGIDSGGQRTQRR